MPIPETLLAAGLWVGLHLLLIWALGLRVTQIRFKHMIGSGHGDVPELERAIRAHGNATEYVPGLLLGLSLLSLMTTTTWLIHVLGATLFISRLLHAWGMNIVSEGGPPPPRAIGNIMTWVATLAISGLLIWKFIFGLVA